MLHTKQVAAITGVHSTSFLSLSTIKLTPHLRLRDIYFPAVSAKSFASVMLRVSLHPSDRGYQVTQTFISIFYGFIIDFFR